LLEAALKEEFNHRLLMRSASGPIQKKSPVNLSSQNSAIPESQQFLMKKHQERSVSQI
jgi:hypothetical protein